MKDKIIENIKRELKDRQSNINKLCRTLHVNRNYISQLKDNTPVSKLKRIADAIGCDLVNLFVGVQTYIFLLIPFFEIINLMGVERKHFRFHIENAISGHCHFAGYNLLKSSLKLKIVLAKSKGAGIFFSTFAPKIFHARIIISNLQLTH